MRYLYKITNKLNGKIYIGQTRKLTRRWSEHKSAAKLDNPKTYIDRIIKENGEENFTYEWIATAKTKSDSNHAEILLISQYQSNQNEIGYNKSPGGDAWSDEDCQKMSLARTGEGNTFYGKRHSNKSRQKISENHTGFSGKNHSEETLIKMSKVKTGIIFTDEHKRNISMSKRGKKQSPEVIARQANSRRKLTDEQENSIKQDKRNTKLIATEYGIKVSLVYAVRSKRSK